MPTTAMFRLEQTHTAVSVVDWSGAAQAVRLLNAPPLTRGTASGAAAETGAVHSVRESGDIPSRR